MDPARAELLEKVWQTLIGKKRLLTAKITEGHKQLRSISAKHLKINEAWLSLKEIERLEAQLEIIDQVVSEGSS